MKLKRFLKEYFFIAAEEGPFMVGALTMVVLGFVPLLYFLGKRDTIALIAMSAFVAIALFWGFVVKAVVHFCVSYSPETGLFLKKQEGKVVAQNPIFGKANVHWCGLPDIQTDWRGRRYFVVETKLIGPDYPLFAMRAKIFVLKDFALEELLHKVVLAMRGSVQELAITSLRRAILEDEAMQKVISKLTSSIVSEDLVRELTETVSCVSLQRPLINISAITLAIQAGLVWTNEITITFH